MLMQFFFYNKNIKEILNHPKFHNATKVTLFFVFKTFNLFQLNYELNLDKTIIKKK